MTLVAATQRPTQKAMGQGAVRSQMNIRISFRVQEQRDVDLILGQGMLKAGWHAHKLNAPGKFLVSAHPSTTPRAAPAPTSSPTTTSKRQSHGMHPRARSSTSSHATRSPQHPPRLPSSRNRASRATATARTRPLR